MTEREVAARWRVNPETVRRLRLSGVLPFFHPCPGRVLYRGCDIAGYESSRTVEAIQQRRGLR